MVAVEAVLAPVEKTVASRRVFLTLLRGPAAFLVLFIHLGYVLPLQVSHNGWVVEAFVRRATTRVGLPEDGAELGVDLFFLISGYLVTERRLVERTGAFLIKRVLRIWPPLLAATAVAWACAVVTDPAQARNLGLVVRTALLLPAPELPGAGPMLLLVAWTLVVEVTFYLLLALGGRWLAQAPLGTAAAFHIVLFIIVLAAQVTGIGVLGTVAGWAAYVFFLLIGQVWYLIEARRIVLIRGMLLITFAVAGFTLTEPRFPLGPVFVLEQQWISFGGAALLFGLGRAVEPLLTRLPGLIQRLACWPGTLSYSLYLVHLPVGTLVVVLALSHSRMPPWHPVANYTLLFLAASAAALAVAALSWYLVERPSQRVARWLVGYLARRIAARKLHTR